jgi:hypothetical protein
LLFILLLPSAPAGILGDIGWNLPSASRHKILLGHIAQELRETPKNI